MNSYFWVKILRMQLIEINDKTGVRLFHEVARIIYRDDPNWVAPLRMEIENTFSPDKNSSFKNGSAIRWVLADDNGRPIGRIAAFIDHNKAEKFDPPTGGVGFFECINDQDSANLLFDNAKEWLVEQGAQGMDGNINFGENMVNWGLLVEGFMPQAYGMPYNKDYYAGLFENYGFRDYFQQFSYHKDLTEPFPERMVKFASYLETRPGYHFEHFNLRNPAKHILDLTEILNETWSNYMEGFTPIETGEISQLLESAKAVIEEEFIWFAYKEEKPIGVVVSFPDVNQILKHFTGRLNFFQILKFLYLKRRKTITRFRVLLAGIIPEYQNSGAIAALFLQMLKTLKKKPHYTEMELSWVADYNPRMRKIYEQIGGVQMKKHITYRYLFDRDRSFERFTNEGGDSRLRKDTGKNNN